MMIITMNADFPACKGELFIKNGIILKFFKKNKSFFQF